MDWRTIDRFPDAEQRQWQARSGIWRRKVVGKKAVEVAIKGWNPMSPLLVGTPELTQLLPPILVTSLQNQVVKCVQGRSQLSLAIVLFFIVICLGLKHMLAQSNMLTAAYILVGIEVFLAAEYWLVFRHPDALIERSLFSFWVRETARIDSIFWACVMLIAGALQLLTQSIYGGIQPVVEQYGIVFHALRSGEAWRLLSGPFLHNDFLHWAANAFLLIFVGMIAGRISRSNAVAVFVAGSVVGALVTWCFVPSADDAYLGVSAGVMAILGFCGGVAWRDRHNFPKALGLTLIAFGLLNIYLSWIYSPNAANDAHVAGLALGIIWGLLYQHTQIRQSLDVDPLKPVTWKQ
jgi:membrane associated rhomboid family serine protease